MTNVEAINAYVSQKYPETMENYEELRQAFIEGMQWNGTHPDANGYCNARVWHYVSDWVDVTHTVTHEVTHEVNGEMVTETVTETITEPMPDLPEYNRVCLVKFSDGTGGISTRSKTSKARNQWITAYRDDIVAWSYYVMK